MFMKFIVFSELHDHVGLVFMISFADQTIDKVKADLEGEIKDTWIPFNNTDACDSITPTCPLEANTSATFELSVPISKLFPAVS